VSEVEKEMDGKGSESHSSLTSDAFYLLVHPSHTFLLGDLGMREKEHVVLTAMQSVLL
jgi:hypothetical protein